MLQAKRVLQSDLDTTIRNLDENAYRKLKARAALLGKTVGETMTDAILVYLGRPQSLPNSGSLRDIAPEAYPESNERLRSEIDTIVYDIKY